jgi:serine protease Do
VDEGRLRVAQVYVGGPAARAGLADGDVLTRVGDQPVDDIDDVQLAVSTLSPGTATTVAYVRGDRSATTKLTLAKLGVAGKVIATVRPDAWRGLRVDYATALDGPALAQAITSGALDPEGCVLVTEVELDSIAWKAGARPGMFISHVAGKRVATPEDFRAAAKNVGKELECQFTQPLATEQDPPAN